jgi:Family of unknown function (DUF6459)
MSRCARAHGIHRLAHKTVRVHAGPDCAMMTASRSVTLQQAPLSSILGECPLSPSPIVSPPRRDTFAVMPVVEYEPPTRSVPQPVPQRRESPHATSRRHSPRAQRRLSSGESRRPAAAVVMSPPMRQAAIFADAALRRVLEVIDRRRPAAQLRPLLAPGLVDSVLSVCGAVAGHGAGHGAGRGAAGDGGAAVLRRMRLQPVGRHNSDTAAEVFGTYSRGERVHAIACRVERVPASNGTRWLVVALHIG